MIKTLIFDNNGVLTTCDDNKTIPEFAKHFQIDEDTLREKFHRMVVPADLGNITTQQFFDNLSAELGKSYKKSDVWKIFLECYIPIPEMRKLLIDQKKEYKIALLTNFIDSFDELNREVWHYEEVFEPENMFVSSKLHLAKPDPEFYQYALGKLNIKPEEVIFIDDREINLIPARKLGMKTILFYTPEQCKNELQLLLEENNA